MSRGGVVVSEGRAWPAVEPRGSQGSHRLDNSDRKSVPYPNCSSVAIWPLVSLDSGTCSSP